MWFPQLRSLLLHWLLNDIWNYNLRNHLILSKVFDRWVRFELIWINVNTSCCNALFLGFVVAVYIFPRSKWPTKDIYLWNVPIRNFKGVKEVFYVKITDIYLWTQLFNFSCKAVSTTLLNQSPIRSDWARMFIRAASPAAPITTEASPCTSADG